MLYKVIQRRAGYNLICYLYHRVADDFVADFVACLEHRGDFVGAELVIIHHAYSVVQVGVKIISDLSERFDLKLFKRFVKLI